MNNMEVIIKNPEIKEGINNNNNTNINNNLNENTIVSLVNSQIELNKSNYYGNNNDKDKDKDNKGSEQNLELPSNKEINTETSEFPYCVVWTPIPILTYLFPSIGHCGICDSNGKIHEYGGSFYFGNDYVSFGKPTKYFRLELSNEEKKNLDKAIEKGDQKYDEEERCCFIDNCHSHIAYIFNQLNYRGKNNYNQISIWWMLVIKGKFVSCCGFFKTYIGFLIIILIIALVVIFLVVIKKK